MVNLALFGNSYVEFLKWKDPNAGKDGGQEEKGTTEDEIVGRHHRLKGHEFEQAPGDSEGQGSLVWSLKESEQLSN